ncbi:DsbC family protein [uncultured Aquabacterium sp.]|jgi:thiol:disulfide interchange protein DsbC|uniref:DsbC family protein n=1 Tax=uncultured Aquabacterium sp. TaxID=158753 RepID=UPI0026387533|nr:DsbC family protein [uncultured Aquabacterium sp.]
MPLTVFRPAAVALALAAGLAAPLPSFAQQPVDLPAAQFNTLRQKLAQRLPDLPPIEGARPAPVPGLIELRGGGHVFYTDANGEYLIDGNVLETRSRRNLTEERLDEINKVDVDQLPLKDAVVWKSGNGKRRLIVFTDPNCGYCKRLERELQQVKDVTVYNFVVAILGDDSRQKAEAIWCAKDRTQTWRDWMLNGVTPPRALGACNSPIQRNGALAQRLRVNGTPAIFFDDGSRVPGAASAATIEQRMLKAQARGG